MGCLKWGSGLGFAMDLAAATLAFMAQTEQDHAKHTNLIVIDCQGKSWMAFKTGMGAAVLLSLSQLVSVLVNRSCSMFFCDSICKRFPEFVCFSACCISWGLGEVLLVWGAHENRSHSCSLKFTRHFLFYGCYACLLHLVCTICYAVCYTGYKIACCCFR